MIELSLHSELYSFGLNDLPKLDFYHYTLTNVFERISPQQQQACVELWLGNGVITSRDAAMARSEQVCYFITETQTGNLVGVNTLYEAGNKDVVQNVWLNRMFIDPKHRSTRLMIVGTAMMLCYAKTFLANRGLYGVVNINENRKLSRAGMRRIFDRLGYRHLGEDNGNHIIFFDFRNIEFIEN